MKRRRIPDKVENQVVQFSARRCCICFGLRFDSNVKRGQIAHLDHKSWNNELSNLAWLCLICHDKYDTKTSQSKGYSISEVKEYRKKLYLQVEIERKAASFVDNSGQSVHNLTNKFGRPHKIIGRNKELNLISAELTKSSNPIVIASGFGGIGKSALARVIAWRFIERKGPFDLIVWIDIRRYNDSQRITFNYVLDEIMRAANQRTRIPAASKEEAKEELVKKELIKHNSLLILDNYEDLLNFPGEEKKVSRFISSFFFQPHIIKSNKIIRVLITTREFSKWLKKEQVSSFSISKLSLENSISLMKRRQDGTVKLNQDQYKRIWQLLGGLPKYLEIAIDQLRTITYYDWVKMILGIKVPLDKQERFFNDLFRHSWKRFDVNLKNILLSITYFWDKASSEGLHVTSGVALNDFHTTLTSTSDAYIENVGTGYSVHPLTHVYCLAKLNSDEYASFKRVSSVRFIEYYLKFTGDTTKNIEWQERELRNIVNAAKLAEVNKCWDHAIRLRANVSNLIRHRGYWQEEMDITLSAVKACRKIGDDEVLAKCLVYDLGWLYLRLEKKTMAEQVLTEGLQLYEKLNDQRGIAKAKRHLGKLSLILGLNDFYEPRNSWNGHLIRTKKYYDESFKTLLRLLRNGVDVKEEIADMNLDFGRFYWLNGKRIENIGRSDQNKAYTSKALDAYQQSNRENWAAMEIFDKIENQRGKTKAWGNLGNTTKEIGKFYIREKSWVKASEYVKSAQKYYENNLAIGRKIKRKDEISHALWGLAEVYELYADYRRINSSIPDIQATLKRALKFARMSYKIYASLGGSLDINATRRLVDRIKNKIET